MGANCIYSWVIITMRVCAAVQGSLDCHNGGWCVVATTSVGAVVRQCCSDRCAGGVQHASINTLVADVCCVFTRLVFRMSMHCLANEMKVMLHKTMAAQPVWMAHYHR